MDPCTRIHRLRFLVIVLVVLKHSPYSALQTVPCTGSLQSFLSYRLPAGAVPLLFAIAGYLIYREERPTVGLYIEKLRRRFHSLLIPYLAWNTIALIIQIAGQAVPMTRPFFHGQQFPLNQLNFGLVLAAFTRQPPAIQPLWFVQDLFVLILASPLLWYACRWSRGAVLPLLLVSSWCCWQFHVPLANLVMPTFYYCLGIFISQLSQAQLPWSSRVVVPVWIVCGVFWFFLKPGGFFRIYPTLSIAFLWILPTMMPARVSALCDRLEPTAFFLYASHILVLQVVKETALALLGHLSGLGALAVYLATPALTILFVLGLFRLLRRSYPRVLAILCGGRQNL